MSKINRMVLNEILNNSNQIDMGQEYKVKSVLSDYGVKTEKEFMEVMNDDWNYILCSKCSYKVDIFSCHFENGSRAICPKCGNRC